MLLAIRQIPNLLLLALLAGVVVNSAYGAQGIAQYGKPKYADGFSHFDYVNPQAPRGGTLTLPNPDRRTSFDKFNPFTLRGVTAPGIAQLMFESLAVGRVLLMGDAQGYIHAFSQAKGEMVARIRHDSSPISAAPLAVGGLILVQSQGGKLAAYSPK